MLQKYNSL